LVGLSSLCLYLASVVPTNRIALAGIAGLFPVAAVLASGRRAGFLCWFGSSLVGLLLVPEKWLVLIYLLFLGLYPVMKSVLEGLRSRAVEWVCKFVFFDAVLTLFVFGFRSVLLPALPAFMQQTGIIYLVFNIIFVVYDIGLSHLIAYFERRFSSAR